MTAVTAKTASEIQPRLSSIVRVPVGSTKNQLTTRTDGEARREARAQAPRGADDEHQQLVDDGHREHVDVVARELDSSVTSATPASPAATPAHGVLRKSRHATPSR